MARAKKEATLTPEERLQAALVPDWEWPYKLPENWCWTTVGAINQYIGSSIDPMKSGNEYFELYSVPSSADDYPEIIFGSEIGSTKQAVEKGDVLLCKINPRINRVWKVSKHTEHTLLASSEWIVVRNSKFFSDYLMWCSMMDTIPITLYASHIDKIRHVNQYVYPMSPYDLCMTFVFERIIYNMPHNKSCIVILESRGKKEDKELLDFIKQIIDRGTSYCSASAFKKIKGVYFNPKWCAMRSDKMSYWELELADLCAYPIHKHFAYGTDDPAYQTILPKIKGYPNVSGHGLKSFP